MNETSARMDCRYVKEADEIEAALAAIADEPFMEVYRDREFRRRYAEKLAQFAYVVVEYHDDWPVAVMALYANDFETGVVYVTLLAFCASEGLRMIESVYQMIQALLAIPAIAQMRRIRLEVNAENRRARKLYEQLGFSYTGEQNGNKLYMEMELQKLLLFLESISQKYGSRRMTGKPSAS